MGKRTQKEVHRDQNASNRKKRGSGGGGGGARRNSNRQLHSSGAGSSGRKNSHRRHVRDGIAGCVDDDGGVDVAGYSDVDVRQRNGELNVADDGEDGGAKAEEGEPNACDVDGESLSPADDAAAAVEDPLKGLSLRMWDFAQCNPKVGEAGRCYLFVCLFFCAWNQRRFAIA